MADLLSVVGSVIPIGTIIKAVGPPDSTWLRCDGSILDKSAYPAYVSEADDLHPAMWKNWTAIDVDQSVAGDYKYGISRIGDLIVAMGVGSTVWYSSDGGETWNTSATGPTVNTFEIANNGSIFVTLGYNDGYAYWSSNGTTWNQVSVPVTDTFRYCKYANGYFIGMTYSARSSSQQYVYSSDGVNWYAAYYPYPTAASVDCIGSDGSQFLIMAYNSDDYYLYKSTNGSTWTQSSTMFLYGHPYNNDYVPYGIHYLNSQWFMTFYGDLKRIAVFEGSNIIDPSDWYMYPIQPQSLLGSYGYAKDAVWTGNHYIMPNYGEEGITIGKDLFHLSAHKGPFRQCPGIVNKGEDYVVALSTSYYSRNAVYRSTGVTYDDTTKFQLPHQIVCDDPGVYHYIKVAQ